MPFYARLSPKAQGKRRRETGAGASGDSRSVLCSCSCFLLQKGGMKESPSFFVCFPKGDGKWAFFSLSDFPLPL